MIITIDDLNYTLSKIYASHWPFPTVESMLGDSNFGWTLFLFSVNHLESRLIETEPYLDPIDSYHVHSEFSPWAEWPEMEEVIRRSTSHKYLYEDAVRCRI